MGVETKPCVDITRDEGGKKSSGCMPGLLLVPFFLRNIKVQRDV